MSAPAWPWLAALGLLVGIGVRSAVWRLAVEAPPRTGCPRCGTGSRWLLAPVRPLTGRCTRCQVRTTAPVLIPELLGAVGFGLAGWIGGGPLRIAALCWLVAVGLAAVLVDAVVQRLPDVLTLPCLAGVLALCCGQAAVSGSLATAVRTVLAGAVVAGFFMVLALVADVGLGDMKLSASLGVVLGYVSWTAVATGLAAGVCLAGFYAVMRLVSGRISVGGRFPLGPFLLFGCVLELACNRL